MCGPGAASAPARALLCLLPLLSALAWQRPGPVGQASRIHLLLTPSVPNTFLPSDPSAGCCLAARILSWSFRDGKSVGSRSRKSLGKLQRWLSEKLKSSPGKDNIYSIPLLPFHSFSVNPSTQIYYLPLSLETLSGVIYHIYCV